MLSSGGEAEFNSLLNLYDEPNVDVATKARALAALGDAPMAALRARALELTVTSNRVKAQDIALVPAAVHGASDDGRQAAWDFFKAHHEQYQARAAGGGLSNLMDGLIAACCGRFCTEAQRADVAAFLRPIHSRRTQRRSRRCWRKWPIPTKYLNYLVSGGSLLSWLDRRASTSF